MGLNFIDHWAGYTAFAVFLVAYLLVILEETFSSEKIETRHGGSWRDLDPGGDRIRLSKPIPPSSLRSCAITCSNMPSYCFSPVRHDVHQYNE